MKALIAYTATVLAAAMALGHTYAWLIAPLLLGVLGLAHDTLEKYPRMQALAKVARGAGVNWPEVRDGLVQLLTGFKAPIVAVGALFLLACGASLTPAQTVTQVQNDSRAAVSAVSVAWLVAGQTCVNVASSTANPALLAKCAAVLDPIRADIIVADGLVNAMADTTAGGQVACILAKDVADLSAAAVIIGASVTEIATAQTLVAVLSGVIGGCPASDAGALVAPAAFDAGAGG